MTAPQQTPEERAVAVLVEATQDGRIDELCESLGVRVLGIFGSAVRHLHDARDVDIAVGFLGEPQLLELIDALTALTNYNDLDIAIVDGANPVLRAAAFVGIPLYERESGQYAVEQMAALAEWRDTEWLRKLALQRLAG